MASYPARRDPNRPPTHPGSIIRETVLPALGRTKVEIAKLAGISRQHLDDIINERKPISPAVAVRFGKLFGNGPRLWIRMQATYDVWHAARNVDLDAIPTIYEDA